GLGSGLLNPQTVALIQHHFRGHDRARAFALLATTVAVATAIGPVVGGALIQVLGPEWGWRWMFLLNAPIGVIAIIGAFRYIPDDRAGQGPARPRPRGHDPAVRGDPGDHAAVP